MQYSTTISLELPVKIDEAEAKLMILASLFGKGEISSGKAAELLGIPRLDFFERVGDYGISVFSDDFDSLGDVMSMSL